MLVSWAAFFHFCKSVRRRVQHEGLRRSYNRSARLKRCILKLMAIAYLPVAIVRQNFYLVVQDVETRNLCRRYHSLKELLLYFERNGQFQPATWNVYNKDMDNRTNNHVEGKWKTRVTKPNSVSKATRVGVTKATSHQGSQSPRQPDSSPPRILDFPRPDCHTLLKLQPPLPKSPKVSNKVNSSIPLFKTQIHGQKKNKIGITN